jgi:hypothetical protein
MQHGRYGPVIGPFGGGEGVKSLADRLPERLEGSSRSKVLLPASDAQPCASPRPYRRASPTPGRSGLITVDQILIPERNAEHPLRYLSR